MSDYHLFGWRVRSALPLPELLPWRGDAREPDIVIEIGSVPPADPDLPQFSPAVQITATAVRIAIPAVACYWVEAGRRVIVQPVLPQDAPDIRVFLLGTVLAILCFQRGLLPLHASAVDVGGQALLLSGVSGAGKSTLAAAFSARGYRLLSDDLCALALADGQPPRVLPAFPRLKLWRDSATRLQVPVTGLERSREELEKFHIPLHGDQFQPDAIPVGQIVFLRTDRLTDAPRTRRMGGLETLRRHDLIHRWRLGVALGQQAALFKGLARLIETTPVFEVARGEDLADLAALVDSVLALVGSRP